MIDKLRSMAVFSKVAELGSFRRAAERLGLSASVVSHHITQLEEQLGVQLLHRSTRHVAMTNEGQRFFESCCAMLQAAETALEGLHTQHAEIGGKLSIVAPAAFSSGPFLRDITQFCTLFPKAQIQLELDDRPRNLIQEGIDVSICFEPQTSAQMVCQAMFSHRPSLFAAPAYIERFGPILAVEDLKCVDWVCHSLETQIVLEDGNGEIVRLNPSVRLLVNSIAALHELVRDGLGVAQLPGMLAQSDVAAGALRPVLPQWRCGEMGCYLVYSAKASAHSLTMRFVDFLNSRINPDARKAQHTV